MISQLNSGSPLISRSFKRCLFSRPYFHWHCDQNALLSSLEYV